MSMTDTGNSWMRKKGAEFLKTLTRVPGPGFVLAIITEPGKYPNSGNLFPHL